MNNLSINYSHSDCKINALRYSEINEKKRTKQWVWVTSFKLFKNNVYDIMSGGRSRHKIENEAFNTLKNHGYHFTHNFGHGKKHLSTVFAYLKIIAFFVDQLQQLGNKDFEKAMKTWKTKKNLWQQIRFIFNNFIIKNLESFWKALIYNEFSYLGFKPP